MALACKHVYCEECIGMWFAEHSTCPLCRAEVPNTGPVPHGNGATDSLLYLF